MSHFKSTDLIFPVFPKTIGSNYIYFFVNYINRLRQQLKIIGLMPSNITAFICGNFYRRIKL